MLIQDNPSSSLSFYGSEEEESDTFLGNWDEIVSQALISHKRGLQVSCALEKGLKSNLGGEVRRACVLVVAWLTSHLTINNVSSTTSRPQSRVRDYDILKLSEDLKQLAQFNLSCDLLQLRVVLMTLKSESLQLLLCKT